MSGGARNGYGSHSLTRDLERATEQRTRIEPAATAAETTLDQLEARRRELERALDQARQALFAHEKILLQLEQQLGALDAERARRTSEETRAAEQAATR